MAGTKDVARFGVLSVVLMAAVLSLSVQTWADDYWQHDPASPGDWFDWANWTTGWPGIGDYVHVDNGGTALIADDDAVAYSLVIGTSLTSKVIQNSGRLDLGSSLGLGAYGSYELSGTGRLTMDYAYLESATGILQTGGVNTVRTNMTVAGKTSGADSLYTLGGTGLLNANRVTVGGDGNGRINQTGGFFQAKYISISATGSYTAAGGTLEITRGLGNMGTFDGQDLGPSISAPSGLVSLCPAANFLNLSSASFSGGDASLVIYDPVRPPESMFKTFTTTGVALPVGGSVTIPSGRTVTGWGVIPGHVDCMGTLTTGGDGSLDITGGIFIRPAGQANLWEATIYTTGDPSGLLTVEDQTSGMSGGTLDLRRMQVGAVGNASFHQSAGTNSVAPAQSEGMNGWLTVGTGAGLQGSYYLGGSGLLETSQTMVGTSGGVGTFEQTGGAHTIGSDLWVQGTSSQPSTYTLSGGQLSALYEYIGPSTSKGSFIHSGGTNTVTGTLYLGSWGSNGGDGTYELSGTGSLVAAKEYLGWAGVGTFYHSGGTNSISGGLYVGYNASTNNTYLLSGTGIITANIERVGNSGKGVFEQTGGINNVLGTLTLGSSSVGTGSYSISAGSLSVSTFNIGYNGTGTFSITDPSASITVSTLLSLGGKGSLSAVPGSTIHMTGTSFENHSSSESNLADLSNLTFVYDNQTPGVSDSFEVASADLGRDPTGFVNNFALGGIELDNNALVKLIDSYNNGNPNGVGGTAEALYLEELTLLPGSTLDLNNLHLYVCDLNHQGGAIIGGELISMCPGDADGNWKVDSADLATWQRNYDPLGTTRTFAQGDWDGNGRIDSADLATWQRSYHPLYMGPASLGSPEVTPEPATLLLVGSGLLTLLGVSGRRRRSARVSS